MNSQRSALVETGIFALFLLFLWSNLGFPQQLDSANYYLEGLLVNSGFKPFLDFNDNKGPLLYYLLSISSFFSGWNLLGGLVLFRLLEVFIYLLLWVSLYRAGIAPALRIASISLFAAAYAAGMPFADETIYSEIPELLCRLGAFYFVLVSRSPLRAGLCAGLAIGFRQTAIIDLPLFLIGFMLEPSRQKNESRIHTGARFFLGALMILAPLTLLAASQGWLAEFYRQAIQWNYSLSQTIPDRDESLLFWKKLATPGFLLLIAAAALGIFSCAGAVIRRHSGAAVSALLLISTVAHLFEAFSSPLWFPHHMIPALGTLTLLTGYGLNGIQLNKPLIMAAGSAVAIAVTFLSQFQVVVRSLTAPRDTHAMAAHQLLGEWINRETPQDSRILVWGYFPDVYLYAQRLPASRFHHNLFLTNQSRLFEPIYQDFLQNFRQDLEVSKPSAIVLSSRSEAYRDLEEFFPGARDYHDSPGVDSRTVSDRPESEALRILVRGDAAHGAEEK